MAREFPAEAGVRFDASRLSWVVLLACVAAIACDGLALLPHETVRPLDPLPGSTPHIDGFANRGVSPAIDTSDVPQGVRQYGSWLGTDLSTGTLVTAWYAVAPGAAVMVSGYPNNPDLKLELQFREGETVATVPVTATNPGERWSRIAIDSPASAWAFRIVATDHSKAKGGWLGLSEPFSTRRVAGFGETEASRNLVLLGALISLVAAIPASFLVWRSLLGNR